MFKAMNTLASWVFFLLLTTMSIQAAAGATCPNFQIKAYALKNALKPNEVFTFFVKVTSLTSSLSGDVSIKIALPNGHDVVAVKSWEMKSDQYHYTSKHPGQMGPVIESSTEGTGTNYYWADLSLRKKKALVYAFKVSEHR